MSNQRISDRLCDNCNAPLYRFPNDGRTQYDNALIIGVEGGYGMFVESAAFGGPTEQIIFCHECAHSLCDAYPGLRALIEPHRSHAHTVEYIENNPDHWGWDYDVVNDHEPEKPVRRVTGSANTDFGLHAG